MQWWALPLVYTISFYLIWLLVFSQILHNKKMIVVWWIILFPLGALIWQLWTKYGNA